MSSNVYTLRGTKKKYVIELHTEVRTQGLQASQAEEWKFQPTYPRNIPPYPPGLHSYQHTQQTQAKSICPPRHNQDAPVLPTGLTSCWEWHGSPIESGVCWAQQHLQSPFPRQHACVWGAQGVPWSQPSDWKWRPMVRPASGDEPWGIYP